MKKIQFLMLLLFVVFSCGTIVDSTKVTNEKWSYIAVEYYTYNSVLDSYNKIDGLDDETPDSEHPINGAFFGSNMKNFYLEFLDNNNLKITYLYGTLETLFLPESNVSWVINNYDNSVTITVLPTDSNSDNIWLSGFTIKNNWPMSDNSTYELTINATDVGKDHFDIPLSTGTLEVKKMKAIFKRS
jgi:hypothetical protein